MAEIVLGAVPIFVSAFQGFIILLDKIQSFRQYKGEIERLRLNVGALSLNYKTEVTRLFFAALGEQKARTLILDPNNSGWRDPDLPKIFMQYLGEGEFRDYISIIKLVLEALDSIQDKLDVFVVPNVQSSRFRAIRDKFRLLFNKDKYKNDINNLRETIACLKVVRESVETSRRVEAGVMTEDGPPPVNSAKTKTHRGTLKESKAIRAFSYSFQDFLRKRWNCDYSSHSRHSGKLFLNSTSQSERGIVLKFLLESRDITTMSRVLFNVHSQPPELHGLADIHIAERGDSEGRETTLSSLCTHLIAISNQLTPSAPSLTHFDAESRTFYKFQPQETESLGLCAGSHPRADLYRFESRPLARLISDYTVIRELEKIKLAAALVRVTLRAHSTAGWPGQQQTSSGCLLEGISFLVQASPDDIIPDISVVLDTLNISVNIGGDDKTAADMANPAEVSTPDSRSPTSESIEDRWKQWKLEVGVQNIVLYWLGVALLSIALWERIEWQDVVVVRRKAASLTRLGKEYVDVVKRLISCKFHALASDLEDDELQLEVFGAIVDPLEEAVGMISSWLGEEPDTSFSQGLDRGAEKVTGGPIFEDGCVEQVRFSCPPHGVIAASGLNDIGHLVQT